MALMSYLGLKSGLESLILVSKVWIRLIFDKSIHRSCTLAQRNQSHSLHVGTHSFPSHSGVDEPFACTTFGSESSRGLVIV